MGDGLKISKDKRHRSSSSLAAIIIEGTRSERKLDIKASIPEVDDHFAVAEARCDELQEKIDLVKSLKRKKKLKRGSMTRVDTRNEVDSAPFITVRTQPKKKSIQDNRLRRIKPTPPRGYLDSATVEQHIMLENMQGYNQMHSKRTVEGPGPHRTKPKNQYLETHRPSPNRRVYQPDGDRRNSAARNKKVLSEVAAMINRPNNENLNYIGRDEQKSPVEIRVSTHKNLQRSNKNETIKEEQLEYTRVRVGTPPGTKQRHVAGQKQFGVNVKNQKTESFRPEVETLFDKQTDHVAGNRASVHETKPQYSIPAALNIKKGRVSESGLIMDDDDDHMIDQQSTTRIAKDRRRLRKFRYRNRRYELPTISSQMKQSGMRCYYENTQHYTNIPFVASKSTAPSHNIGVNIQQVLNGLKIQQPLCGIPLTIAHHMGLRHIPDKSMKHPLSALPSLEINEVNAIQVGKRLLRLPSYKYMSYNRLLNLYREGDGMVPRFLRAISRPHYFYTSMYNLNTNRDDMDNATSKGNCYSQEAKQNLAEYASLYKEYEKLDKIVKEGNCDPDCEIRKNDLSRELAAREEQIRRAVNEYRKEVDVSPLRASASTAEEGYRHSTFKLNKY